VGRSRLRGLALATVAYSLAFIAPSTSAQVVLSEIMYNPVGGNTNEFVELHNVGTNAVDVGGWYFTDGITYTFPAPSVMGADAYLVVAVNRSSFTALYPDVTNLAAGVYVGQLSNQGEKVAFADTANNVIFSVTYNNKEPWPLAAAGLGSSLVLADPFTSADNPSNWVASAQLNGSPGGPDRFFVRDVVINEVLAHTDPPQEDAVELRNLTTNAISLAGWYLSDDNAVRKKYRFPEGTVILPQGYLTVYQAQMTTALVPFALSAKGDDLYLSEANGADQLVRYVDQYLYDASQNGFSFGRCPDGTGEFVTLATPTFGVSSPASVEEFRTGTGARNSGPKVGPVVINEVMYHPSESNVLGRLPSEYVEILNISAVPVPLYNVQEPTNTWSLTGGISYDFPTNLTLQPGQYLLIIATNAIAEFRQSYGLSTNVLVFGPWDKSLGNAGDTVRLRAPNTVELPANTLGRYVVDEVTYKDQLPWPLAADGLGGSLERTDPLAYGNTAANWHSVPGTATPGTTNSVYVPPGAIIISEIMAVNRSTLRDEDGEFSDWIELCNTSAQTVSLKGWHLTDQADIPTLWTFPDVSIPAQGQLVVFASQKNRVNPLSQLHTSFALDAAGEYLALFRDDLVLECAFDPAFPAQSADVGYGIASIGTRTETTIQSGTSGRYLVPTNAAMLASGWNTRTFNDADWKTAGNGIGYDTAVDYRPYFQTDLAAEMKDKQGSAFVRYPFVLDSSASVAQLLLRLKFEDGVAAWLNGTLVVSNNAPAPLTWNSSDAANRSDSLALVFQDFDLSAFAHLLVDGTNVLAMQLINSGAGSSDLLLMSELQLSWPVSTGSVARVSGYLSPATPGSANGAILPGVAPAPVLSHPGGVFAGTLSVTVACANVSATIRYTLDGSDPTTNSPIYTIPLTLTAETEILTRAFVTGLVPSPVTGAVYRRSFLGINEILADNVAATPEINDFTDFGDWIELYNGGTNAIDLSGYYLSDNLDQPFRWQIPAGASIPAGGHLIFWADGYDSKPGLALKRTFWPNSSFTTRYYHTNFKLSSDGEQVGLFTPGGSLVDGVTFGVQQGDISLGRYPDGGNTWGFFGESTASATNRAPQLSQNLHRAPTVVVSPAEPLFMAGPVTVTLSSGAGVSAIRYTLDCSQPNSSSLLYTTAFTVTTNTVVRARAFADDLHPGPVTTRTFLFNLRQTDLPIVSFVIDPVLLYDKVTGIYTNNLKEREVPGTIQFCTGPSNSVFKFDAGFRLFSLNTFLKAQKPLTVYLDSKYGTSELGYQLFPEKPIGLFDRFVLRNGCDDWSITIFRDGLSAKMFEGQIRNALQGYRPTSSYMNGAYHGLFNIREKLDEMYFSKNYNVPLDQIDFFEMDGGGTSADPIIVNGTDAGWLALTAYISSHSLADPAAYAYVRSQVDVEDLADFVIASCCVSHTAWYWNRKWWRENGPNGRWRWGFFDLDRTFSSTSTGTLADMAANMEVFHELLDSQEFKDYFIQRCAAQVSSTFNPSRVIPIIDREAARIRNEITYHVDLYSSKGGIASTNAWESGVNSIKTFARARPAVVMQHLSQLLANSNEISKVSIATAAGGGTVRANYVPLLDGVTNTFISGIPVTLTAVPKIGQTFAYWVISNGVINLSNKGSQWRYKVATNEIAGWNQSSFSDTAWAMGAGQLGYGDSDETTVIGNTTNSRITTAYFRRTVVLNNASTIHSLDLQLLRDDGAIVYLNGSELLRSNMPTGLVSVTTFASSNISSTSVPNENFYNPFTISPATFLEGTNVIAVEVHQTSDNYNDFGFDLQASATRVISGVTTNASPVLTFVPDSMTAQNITAVFVPTGLSQIPTNVTGNLTLTAAGSPWYATGDIYVPSNTSLTAEPGVTIQMPDRASMYVQGQLLLLGTPADPVRIVPNTSEGAQALLYANPDLSGTAALSNRWGGIGFRYADHTGILSNVYVRGASLTYADPVNFKGAINALGSDLYMDGLDVDDVHYPIFVQEGNSTVLCNSRLHINVVGDAINIKRAQYARVENCEMFSASTTIDTDAVDYDGIQGGIIRGNYLHDFMGGNNDAIDIGEGTLDLLVENNRIERCFDKAVSIGQASTARVCRNVISAVDMGLGIKDAGSYGLIEHNTFRDVSHAVAVYEKNLGVGGGSADVRNCIVSHPTLAPFTCDTLSTLSVSYTLCDTEFVPGTGNLFSEPQFERPSEGNFRLQTGSAAVDAGDPASSLDPDGSRADLGALPFDWREGHAVISEIHYNPAVVGQAEYVELTNPGGSQLDLSGYSFSKGFTYTFPESTTLNPGTHLVVASSPYTPYDAPALVWTAGTLDNAGEVIELIDAVSNEIDRVAYSPLAPWPVEPDGLGSALALIHPRWNNALPGSWHASTLPGGSPGTQEMAARDTPVWWLAQWGATNNFDGAATDDWDHDGSANWAEYVAGTQPTNASSVLTVSIASAGGALRVTCPTVPAGTGYGKQRYYALESRTNLLSGTWTEISGYTDIIGAGQTILYTNAPTRTGFIRAKAALR
jgi:hypothetical protein